MFFYYTPMWYFFLVFLVPLFVQIKLKRTFDRYSRIRSRSGITAHAAARAILDSYGLSRVPVRAIAGQLTDHYDPRDRSLSLSESVYNSTSIAAIGVAAHEVGHAVQHAQSYFPLKLRGALVPVTNIASQASIPLFIVGLWAGASRLMNLGILLFAGVLVFHLITLPVEFDASRRALRILSSNGMMTDEEVGGTRKVLFAAALTYVAGALEALLMLIRLIMLRNSRSRD